MKNLKEFILEGKQQKHVDTATVADFYQWYCAGEMPDGKADTSIINDEDCQGLLDNGWFDHFDDSDTKGCKDIAEWFKKNWDKQIKVTSIDIGNCWSISFELDNKTYDCDAMNYFGGEIDDEKY